MASLTGGGLELTELSEHIKEPAVDKLEGGESAMNAMLLLLRLLTILAWREGARPDSG